MSRCAIEEREAPSYNQPQPPPGADRPVEAIDTLRFLRLIETLYHKTGISEWGMAFVRWIVFVGEHIRPTTCYKLADVAAHFHLSERQICRNLQALKKSGLLHMTPCVDENGKKTKYRCYDCTPFLNTMAALIRAHLRSGLPEETCACHSTIAAASSLSSCPTGDRARAASSDKSVLSSDVLHDTSVPHADVLYDTSVPKADVADMLTVSHLTLTSMMEDDTIGLGDRCVSTDACAGAASEICMTSLSHAPERASEDHLQAHGTDVSAPSLSPSDADHQPDMSWMSIFWALSNSNSSYKYNNKYNNITLSNSNSKDTHAPEAERVSDCVLPPGFFSASTTDGVICDPHDCQQRECPASSAACLARASERIIAESQQASYEMMERCAAPAGEQGCSSEGTVKDSRRRLGSAKARERERVNALLAESRAASNAVLGVNAKRTIHHIAREFNDMALYASCVQTTTLYRHLLRINEVEDQHTLADPDLFLSEMMQLTYERLRDIQFRCTDCERRPNGMPLFFTDLRGQVVELVEHIQQLRQQEAQAASTNPQAEQPRDEELIIPDWKPERPLRNVNDPLSAADDHRLLEHVHNIPLENPRELVDHARRLKVVMSEEEAGQILAGIASDRLWNLIVQAVRQELYYEIKASWVVQPRYGLR